VISRWTSQLTAEPVSDLSETAMSPVSDVTLGSEEKSDLRAKEDRPFLDAALDPAGPCDTDAEKLCLPNVCSTRGPICVELGPPARIRNQAIYRDFSEVTEQRDPGDLMPSPASDLVPPSTTTSDENLILPSNTTTDDTKTEGPITEPRLSIPKMLEGDARLDQRDRLVTIQEIGPTGGTQTAPASQVLDDAPSDDSEEESEMVVRNSILPVRRLPDPAVPTANARRLPRLDSSVVSSASNFADSPRLTNPEIRRDLQEVWSGSKELLAGVTPDEAIPTPDDQDLELLSPSVRPVSPSLVWLGGPDFLPEETEFPPANCRDEAV